MNYSLHNIICTFSQDLPLGSLTPVFGCPMKTSRVYSDGSLLQLLLMLVQQLLLQTDDVLALVVVDEVHALQCGDDVIFLDTCLFTNLIDCYHRSLTIITCSLHTKQHLNMFKYFQVSDNVFVTWRMAWVQYDL